MKDDVITVEGEVVENLHNTLFKVKLEMTHYDLNRGRIVYRK